ncbi:MAG: lactoylglutathione lyase [Clostridiaceae bacterium]|nr:lactoylglutathione lyase [Clostridiaceae bacterium]
MQFTFSHNNINVMDLEKSIRFYEENLGLKETRRSAPEHGEFILVFLGDGVTNHRLELTYLRDRKEPYNLGDNEIHLALEVDDMQAAYELHKKNDVICYENKGMGIYFICDPDGYWIEIIPKKKRE